MTDETKPELFAQESVERSEAFNEEAWKRLMDEIEEHRKNGSLRGIFVFELLETAQTPANLQAGIFSFVTHGLAATLLQAVHESAEVMLAPHAIKDAIAEGVDVMVLRPEDLLHDEPPSAEAPAGACGTPTESPLKH